MCTNICISTVKQDYPKIRGFIRLVIQGRPCNFIFTCLTSVDWKRPFFLEVKQGTNGFQV